MRKIIFISAIIMAMTSCAKALDTERIDNVDDINFTNTITHNGRSYEITNIDIYIEDDMDGEWGFTEPSFIIEGEARHIVSERILRNERTTVYDVVAFEAVIPVSNYGKSHDISGGESRGAMAFGKGRRTEIRDEYGYSVASSGIKGILCVNSDNGLTSETVTEEGSTPTGNPKRAMYYIDVERTYADFYRLRMIFEDSEGNKYSVAYKGEKE